MHQFTHIVSTHIVKQYLTHNSYFIDLLLKTSQCCIHSHSKHDAMLHVTFRALA